MTEADISRLNELRHGLLALHKSLLDTERLRYERVHGRVEGGAAMLQLLAFDPAFAWLRLLSALIVEIDERLDDKKNPVGPDDATKFRDQTLGLLTAKENGDEFQRNLYRSQQEHPEVVIAQARVEKTLRF